MPRRTVLRGATLLFAALLGLAACSSPGSSPSAHTPAVPPSSSAPAASASSVAPATPSDPAPSPTTEPHAQGSTGPVVRTGDLEGSYDVGDHELHVECRGR